MIKSLLITKHVRSKILAAIVAAMGVLNVISSLLLYSPQRLEWLRTVLPPEITQGSRGLNLVAGFFLIAIAWNLAGRRKIAFTITNWLLVISAISHITKGLDIEEFLVTMTLIGILWYYRGDYTVKSDPDARKTLLFAVPYAIIFFFGYSITGFYLLKHQFIPSFNINSVIDEIFNLSTFQGEMLYTALTKHARWFMESITLLAGVGLLYILHILTLPVLHAGKSRSRDRDTVREILTDYAKGSLAYYALGFDKSYYFSDNDSCVIPYVLEGNVALSAGDPIGPREEIAKTIEKFCTFAEENQWIPAFYQADESNIAIYKSRNLKVLKIGEEAMIDIQEFTTKGKPRADIRTCVNRGKRENWQFNYYEGPVDDEKIKTQLVEISREWLEQKSGGEMGFTMGATSITGDEDTLVTVASDADGKVMAFCTWAPMFAANGWSLDFMRRLPDAPNGVMEFLITTTIEETKKKGFRLISLGLAPLSNVVEEPKETKETGEAKEIIKATKETTETKESKDPNETEERRDFLSLEKGLEYVSEKFNTVYHFKSLRHFKEKFAPRWENSYLIYPGLVDFPRVAYALVRAQMPELGIGEIAEIVGEGMKKGKE